MQNKFLIFWCTFFFLFNCETRKSNLELLDCIIINSSSYSTVTSMESYNETFAENDSIFYYNHKMYKNGKLYILNDSIKNEQIITKYKLKKINNAEFFKYNIKNYKDHFSYKDIILGKQIVCDSGYVVTLKSKQNDIYQFIDLKNKLMLLQISSKGKTYRFNIEKKYPEEENKFGNGSSNAFLYDIDKDGNEEFLVIFENSIDYLLYAQIYKFR